MLRQSRQRSARHRVPQQIDLFAENAPTIGGMPVRRIDRLLIDQHGIEDKNVGVFAEVVAMLLMHEPDAPIWR